MTKLIRDFTVVHNKKINREYFILDLQSHETLPPILPGQFAEVRVDHPGVFLRRPVSVYDVDQERNVLRLLIAVAGKGTGALYGMVEGQVLNLVFPLGNGFKLPGDQDLLLVGGGIGVAPLLYLGRRLREQGSRPVFLLGYRNKGYLVESAQFEKYGELLITTDDGSHGVHGLVTQHPMFAGGLTGFHRVYCCGPLVMMKAVAALCRKAGVPCEVSLENTMACGFGACLCCVQQTGEGNRLVCTDGPVFNTEELVW